MGAQKKRPQKDGPSLGTKLFATVVGGALIVFPEPATTLAGLGIVTATWAPDVLDLVRGQ